MSGFFVTEQQADARAFAEAQDRAAAPPPRRPSFVNPLDIGRIQELAPILTGQESDIQDVGDAIDLGVGSAQGLFVGAPARLGEGALDFAQGLSRSLTAPVVIDRRGFPEADPLTERTELEEGLERAATDLAEFRRNVLAPKPDAPFLAQLGYGIGESLGPAIAGAVVAGPAGAAGASALAFTTPTERDLMAQGVDRETARGSGLIMGATMAAGVVAPVALPGRLATRVVTGAGANAAIGIGQRASMETYLRARGYEEQANQYRAFDATQLAVDVVVGGVFGGIFGSRPPHLREGEPVAPLETLTQDEIDAAVADADRLQRNVQSAPGVPVNLEARRAHMEAMRTVERQMAMDEEINVSPSVFDGAEFAPPMSEIDDIQLSITGARQVLDGAEWRLKTFVQRSGGILDDRGDIAGRVGGRNRYPGLFNRNGRSIDDLALRAWEDGYFPELNERPTVNEFVDALSDDLDGRPRYAGDDAAARAEARSILEFYQEQGIDTSLEGAELRDAITRHFATQLDPQRIAIDAAAEVLADSGFADLEADIARLRGLLTERGAPPEEDIGIGLGDVGAGRVAREPIARNRQEIPEWAQRTPPEPGVRMRQAEPEPLPAVDADERSLAKSLDKALRSAEWTTPEAAERRRGEAIADLVEWYANRQDGLRRLARAIEDAPNEQRRSALQEVQRILDEAPKASREKERLGQRAREREQADNAAETVFDAYNDFQSELQDFVREFDALKALRNDIPNEVREPVEAILRVVDAIETSPLDMTPWAETEARVRALLADDSVPMPDEFRVALTKFADELAQAQARKQTIIDVLNPEREFDGYFEGYGELERLFLATKDDDLYVERVGDVLNDATFGDPDAAEAYEQIRPLLAKLRRNIDELWDEWQSALGREIQEIADRPFRADPPSDIQIALYRTDLALRDVLEAFDGGVTQESGLRPYSRPRGVMFSMGERGSSSPAAREPGLIGRLINRIAAPQREIDRLKARIAELETRYRTDKLTGLRNQVAFEEDADLGWPIVSAIDMDGLKRLNDSVGHEAADLVLKRLGEILLASEGDDVRFYRRSGDEFAGRFASEDDARAVMSELQSALERVAVVFDLDGGSMVYEGIGISYGIADTYSAADIAALADKERRLAAGIREEARASGPPRRLRSYSEGQDNQRAPDPVVGPRREVTPSVQAGLRVARRMFGRDADRVLKKGSMVILNDWRDLPADLLREVTTKVRAAGAQDKMLSVDGRPVLRVTSFHGGRRPLNTGRRVWSTTDAEVASRYADRLGPGMARVTTVENTFANPMMVNGEGAVLNRKFDVPKLIEQAEAAGHDGIVFENVIDQPGDPRDAEPITVYLSLNSAASKVIRADYRAGGLVQFLADALGPRVFFSRGGEVDQPFMVRPQWASREVGRDVYGVTVYPGASVRMARRMMADARRNQQSQVLRWLVDDEGQAFVWAGDTVQHGDVWAHMGRTGLEDAVDAGRVFKGVINSADDNNGISSFSRAITQGGKGAPKASFGGPLSTLSPLIAEARALADQGKSAAAIWSETWTRFGAGAFKGTDGRWRVEIDDSQARLREEVGAQMVASEDSWRFKGRLGDVLDHPKLMEAYPWLADTPVFLMRPWRAGAAFDQRSGRIEAMGRTPADILSGLLHEVQHRIQQAEGWDQGTNWRSLGRQTKQRLAEVEDALSRLPKRTDKPGVGHNSRQALEEARAALRDSLAILGDDTSQSGDVFGGAGRVEFTLYERDPGEVEARNVQTRRTMSANERRARRPDETIDVPRSQIVSALDGAVLSLDGIDAIRVDAQKAADSYGVDAGDVLTADDQSWFVNNGVRSAIRQEEYNLHLLTVHIKNTVREIEGLPPAFSPQGVARAWLRMRGQRRVVRTRAELEAALSEARAKLPVAQARVAFVKALAERSLDRIGLRTESLNLRELLAAADLGVADDGPKASFGDARLFSALERFVSGSKTTRAPGSQWWATISKAPGIKREELEWTGLEEWLKARDAEDMESSASGRPSSDGSVAPGTDARATAVSRVEMVDPRSLTFREEQQHRLDGVRTLFPSGEGYFAIVTSGNVILDGHNRTRVALERGDMIPRVEVSPVVYARLKGAGFDEVDIAHWALGEAREDDAATSIRQQFAGVDFFRSDAAIHQLLDPQVSSGGTGAKRPRGIPREDVLSFIQSNGVRVEEVRLGVETPETAALQQELLPLIEERDRLQNAMIGDNSVAIAAATQDPTVQEAAQAFREAQAAETEAIARELDGEPADAEAAFQALDRARLNLRKAAKDVVSRLSERIVRLESQARSNPNNTRWSEYTLPGGENYTELLLKLPTAFDQASAQAERIFAGRTYDELSPQERAQIDALNDGANSRQDYRSSHWDQPNVLAHVRFKDRTGPNGERVLAVEEFQSDWHQAGRERGYAGPDAKKRAAEARALADAATAELKQVQAEMMEALQHPSVRAHFEAFGTQAEKDAIRDFADPIKASWLTDRLRPMSVIAMRNDRVDADIRESLSRLVGKEKDLVTTQIEQQRIAVSLDYVDVPDAPFKNNAWASLALKRMIIHAVENGYDAVAWIPGNIQNGKVVENTGDNRGAFYDKVMVNIANDLGKKYGARVQRASMADAGDVQFHSLPITPAMRQQVQAEGLPLFSRGGMNLSGMKGLSYDGKAHFFAENIADDEWRGLFLHELGTHLGLKPMLGDDKWEGVLNHVERLFEAGHPAVVAARAEAEKKSLNPIHVPEETIAYLVERNADIPIIRRLIADVRAWLYRTFGDRPWIGQLTPDDITALAAAAARKWVRDEARGKAQPVEVGPQASRGWDEDAPTPRGPLGRFGGRQIPVAPEIGTPEWDAAVQAAKEKQSSGERLTAQERWMLQVDEGPKASIGDQDPVRALIQDDPDLAIRMPNGRNMGAGRALDEADNQIRVSRELAEGSRAAAACAIKHGGRLVTSGGIVALGAAARGAGGGIGGMAAGLTLGAAAGGTIAAVSAFGQGQDARRQAFAAMQAERDEANERASLAQGRRLKAQAEEKPSARDIIEEDGLNALKPETPVDTLIETLGEIEGVDPAYLSRMITRESAGRADAANPNSSAVGLAQMIESTWSAELRRHGGRYGLDVNPKSQEALALRTDPRWAVAIAAAHTRANAEALQKALGREPTHRDAYGAHFMGVSGYVRLARAAERGAANAAELFPREAEANRTIFYHRNGRARTAQQVIENLHQGKSDAPVLTD